MFNKILIKSESRSAKRLLSIRDIVDMMFYYGEVHVVVSQFELGQLLKVFGEDVLYELIKTARLIVHPCDQHIGAVNQNGLYSAGMFRHNYDSVEQLLYMFHRQFKKNSSDNMKFASKFSKVLDEYKYPYSVQESIYKDIENDIFLSKAARIFIKQYYPEYRNTDEIALHAESVQAQLEGMYHIEGNLNIDELNTMHHELGYSGDFSYSTILLAIGETAQDCYLSSELESELITNGRWAQVYELRINECLQRTAKSQEQINIFQEAVAYDYYSIGDAFVGNRITPVELLSLVNNSNSIKFREWLSSLSGDKPLTFELYNQQSYLKSNNLFVKIIRVLIPAVIGVVNPIAGVGSSILDGTVVNRMINGWKPSIFINKVLRKTNHLKN